MNVKFECVGSQASDILLNLEDISGGWMGLGTGLLKRINVNNLSM